MPNYFRVLELWISERHFLNQCPTSKSWVSWMLMYTYFSFDVYCTSWKAAQALVKFISLQKQFLILIKFETSSPFLKAINWIKIKKVQSGKAILIKIFSSLEVLSWQKMLLRVTCFDSTGQLEASIINWNQKVTAEKESMTFRLIPSSYIGLKAIEKCILTDCTPTLLNWDHFLSLLLSSIIWHVHSFPRLCLFELNPQLFLSYLTLKFLFFRFSFSPSLSYLGWFAIWSFLLFFLQGFGLISDLSILFLSLKVVHCNLVVDQLVRPPVSPPEPQTYPAGSQSLYGSKSVLEPAHL